MNQFININGTIINLANVVSIEWQRRANGGMPDGLTIHCVTVEDNQLYTPIWRDNSPAAHKAYEWLQKACLATFEDEAIA